MDVSSGQCSYGLVVGEFVCKSSRSRADSAEFAVLVVVLPSEGLGGAWWWAKHQCQNQVDLTKHLILLSGDGRLDGIWCSVAAGNRT